MAALTKTERIEKVAEWLIEKTENQAVEMAISEWGMTENTARNYVEQAKGYIHQPGEEPPKMEEVGYVPKPGEENTAILIVEQRSFNPATGEKESVAKRVTFNSVGDWNVFTKPVEVGKDAHGNKLMMPQYRLLGHSVNEVVYIPKGFSKIETDPWVKGKDTLGRPVEKPLVRQ